MRSGRAGAGGVGGQVIDGPEFSRELEPEFSRELEIARVPSGGRAFAIEADAAERAALADRFDLVAISELRASGRVAWLPDGEVLVLEGRLEAQVTQRCVRTLEPVPARLCVPLRRSFVARPAGAGTIVVDPEADEPEPLEGGRLDLGEIAAEELVLALDPYPKLPDEAGEPASIEAGRGADRWAPHARTGGAG